MLLVTPIRIALAGALIGGSIAEGLSRTSALLAVAFGAVVFGLAGAASARKTVRIGALPAPPLDSRYSNWWQATIRAALPSTVVISLLGAVGLGFSEGLAAVCGGLLVGMALVGLGLGLILLDEERRDRRRLYVDWSILQPRRYVSRSP